MNQGLAYEISGVMPAAILTGLFVSTCTLQVPDGNFDGSGAPSGVFVNSSIVAVPCQHEPPSTLRVQATEVKALNEITSKGLRHVLLNGFYPAAKSLKQAGQLRAIVTDPDGTITNYEVFGVEIDSQQIMTRMDVELFNV